MTAEHYETEEEFYAQFPPKKAEAIKAYWASKSPEEIELAKAEFLRMAHMQDVKDATTSEDVAIQLLEMAASYLEKREQMPFHLADHIAKAFRATAKANETDTLPLSESRRNTLAAKLNITAPNKRPAVDRNYLGLSVFRLMIEEAQQGRPISETKAAKEIAGKLGISHRAAKEHWTAWKEAKPESYKILLRVG